MSASQVPLTHQESRGAQALAQAPKNLTTTRRLADSVPTFTPIQKGNLLVEYTERGNKLIFHVYHTERKRLVAEALQEANQLSNNPRHLVRLDERLTEQLQAYPWWNEIGNKLHYNFSEFFRDDVKVVFDPEVDSWSVIVAKPGLPTAWTPTSREVLVSKLYNHLVQG